MPKNKPYLYTVPKYLYFVTAQEKVEEFVRQRQTPTLMIHSRREGKTLLAPSCTRWVCGSRLLTAGAGDGAAVWWPAKSRGLLNGCFIERGVSAGFSRCQGTQRGASRRRPCLSGCSHLHPRPTGNLLLLASETAPALGLPYRGRRPWQKNQRFGETRRV